MDDLHDKMALMMKAYHDLMSYVEDYHQEMMVPKEEESPMEDMGEMEEEPVPFDEESGPMAPMFSKRLAYRSDDLNAYDPMYNVGAPLGIPMAVLVRFGNSDMLKPAMGDEE